MLIWLLGTALAQPYGQTTDLLDHMEAHFAAATDASWYVALGNMEATQEAAAKLDHEPVSALPRAWRAQARRMQRAARGVVAAADVQSAAPAVAALGATCATCHVGNPEGPRLSADEVKMEVLTPLGQHALAPYWLWVGFVMNSEPAWNNGATALVGAPVAPGTQALGPAYDKLAAEVKSAKAGEREAIMGRLLATCHDCHLAAKVTVAP